MSKHIFTQGVGLLTQGRTTLADIKTALKAEGFALGSEAKMEDWRYSGPSVIVPYLPEVNGNLLVDVVDRPWPDEEWEFMDDPELCEAAAEGMFGPFGDPGGLGRAAFQSSDGEWTQKVVKSHRGFIRLRLSYSYGRDNPPNLPEHYHPIEELNFVSLVTMALFKAPGVLAAFNPNGETLLAPEVFKQVWDACGQAKLLPLPLWVNFRLIFINDDYDFMGTIGNSQFDVPDVEVVCPQGADRGDLSYFAYQMTSDMAKLGRKFKPGALIQGPKGAGKTWIAEPLDVGLTIPRRQVVRFCPQAQHQAISQTLAALEEAANRPAKGSKRRRK